MLASKSYPTFNTQPVKCHERSQHNLSSVRSIFRSYSGMKAGRHTKEVKMLLEMLKRYNETKSISAAADICKYLTDLYQVELEAINEKPA